MCGICGKISFTHQSVQRDLILRMNATLFHRGPDEEGSYFSKDNSFGMAMRRLKIIDLSTGTQPIFNETGELAVILNGEIYNYIELRAELTKLGHSFKTTSDTEILVHAYESYGLEFLEKLNGIFAFAIWDARKKQVLIVRDRMGVKPLYYRQNASGVSFASEIKALLVDPDCSRDIDLAALDDYFSLLYVPGPRSIFKSIKKLEPGHFLLCDLDKKTVQNKSYWDVPLIQNPVKRPWPYYEEQLDFLLKDAIRLELRSDVPNGLFLSSGLDSSAIAYYASTVSASKVKSYTVHFSESSYSEQEGARMVAEACGLEHCEIELTPNIENLVLKTSDFFDEPFADTSAVPTFLLCQAVKKHITVALSGEGGDELFAGYPTYIATRLAPYWRAMPNFIKQSVSGLASRLPVSWERLSWEFKLKEFLRGSQAQTVERCHFAWKEIFSKEYKSQIYGEALLKVQENHDSFESFDRLFTKAQGGTSLPTLLYVDQQTYMVDEFLVKSDRMSMANALEVRVPILDHRIVEFAAQIPPEYKLSGHTTKMPLRCLLKNKLPKPIVEGSKKGFSPPISHWISHEIKDFVREVLSEDSIRKTGLLNVTAVHKLFEEHCQKKRDHHRRIWALVNFVLWHRRWM